MSDEQPRVMVIGMGAVTAQGLTEEALWEGVRAGRVAIRPVRHLPMDGFGTRIGGEVHIVYQPEHEYRRPSGHREPYLDFGIRAAEEAMAQAGANQLGVPGDRWAVVAATCTAGLLSAEDWYAGNLIWGTKEPGLLLLVAPQALPEALSAAFGIRGPSVSINTACASGSNAIGYAWQLIRSGQADAVLVGGSDSFSDLVFAGFSSLESLSPASAAPYSGLRQGLSLGEGSGMLVLVREDVAVRAGATPLAEVRGYGLSADGYHPTAPHPDGEGAARAIQAALLAGGLQPEQVDYINGHGTGTPKNDSAETAAIKRALGDHARSVAISSTKSMIGHLLGAAGAVEGIVTIRALLEQVAPPTANFETGDPELTLDYVPNQARPMPIRAAISNNFGFGGANAVVAFSRPGELPPAPPLQPEPVVVTGLAALTCAGTTVADAWQAFQEGRATGGRVEFDPSAVLPPRERRRMDRLGVLATVASHGALADSGLAIGPENRHRVGVMFATAIGSTEANENFFRPLIEEGPELANPAVFPNTVYNAAAGHVAMLLGTVGPTSTVTAGHAASAVGLCYAHDIVAYGWADAMICVAADVLTDTVQEAYQELGLGVDRPGRPKLSEAGVALVLERRSAARARGARIYAETLAYAMTSDARGLGRWSHNGEGIERAMRLCLQRAGAGHADLDVIWTNASGFWAMDRTERRAIDRVFGNWPWLAEPKRYLGEPIGAGTGLAAVLAAYAIHSGYTHPGFVALVNGCSLGGTNVSIALTGPRG